VILSSELDSIDSIESCKPASSNDTKTEAYGKVGLLDVSGGSIWFDSKDFVWVFGCRRRRRGMKETLKCSQSAEIDNLQVNEGIPWE
jgi:hypothetical protein